MPIHDWTRVDAGIFHAFHHSWIEEIARALNRGILPGDYYALAEQVSGKYGPDVLTLEGPRGGDAPPANGSISNGGVLTLPKIKPVAESNLEFYRKKQKAIAVRHVSDDGLVAMVEIVSRGNKAGRKAFRAFIDKAAALLDEGIHLLIIDVQARTKRDPESIHAVIWEELSGEEDYAAPKDKPFTLASYESAGVVRAYVVHAGLGEALADMPLFLEPQETVTVPLEATYNAAFAEMPRRWRNVLEPARPESPSP
jgi:Protein of unknown function (DUF4058)